MVLWGPDKAEVAIPWRTLEIAVKKFLIGLYDFYGVSNDSYGIHGFEIISSAGVTTMKFTTLNYSSLILVCKLAIGKFCTAFNP